jgi:hypothetical protein
MVSDEQIQRWLDRTFPRDVYATRWQTRYYAGPGGRVLVRRKLQALAERLDALGIPYGWYDDPYQFPYLLVERTAR